MHTEISGSEFNAIYKDVKFYKFLNNDLIHYGFKYQLGLNVDNIPFNPNKSCSRGGLYFCEDKYCHKYITDYGEYIAIIEIPHDARVYVEDFKFKADKLIIKNIVNFNDIGDDFWSKYLSSTYWTLKYIKVQTEEMCIETVKRYGLALQYVKEQFQTEKICSEAVKRCGLALQYVKEQFQTKEICTEAVKQDACALRYVKEQNAEICCEAVKQNGYALKYINDNLAADSQMVKICSEAVKQNGHALQFVQEKFAVSVADQKEIRNLAVQQNGCALRHVKAEDQNEDMCCEAVKQNGKALLYVKNQNEEICSRAVEQNSIALKYVKDIFLTEKLCKLAEYNVLSRS